MKRLLYLWCDQNGEVKKQFVKTSMSEGDLVADLWQLGPSRTLIASMADKGFTLSNWHIVSAAEPSFQI